MRLDFVGVGPQRAGTSWLYANFLKHPEVSLPKPPVKETYFFDAHYHRGLDWYAKYFDSTNSTEKVTGEFGASYFDVAETPQRIQAVNPRCKIIISLRNPVDRVQSLFWLHLKYGQVSPDFEAAIQQMPRIITCNHYRQLIPHWAKVFGYERLHFTILDDIKRYPKQSLDEICEFLDIGQVLSGEMVNDRNETSLPKHMWLHRLKSTIAQVAQEYHLYSVLWLGRKVSQHLPAALTAPQDKRDYPTLTIEQRKKLVDLYEADIVFLEMLLHRSFDTWRTDSVETVNSEGAKR